MLTERFCINRPLLQIVGTIIKTKFGRYDVTSYGIYVQCMYRWI